MTDRREMAGDIGRLRRASRRLMDMGDCIFCKMVSGEIPCSKIYEDAHTFAFLDIHPVSKGHALVITKKHYDTILDMGEVDGVALAKASVKVARAVKEATQADGINLLHNIGAAAGQVIFHAHVHLIPRFSHDKADMRWVRKKYDGPDEQSGYAEKIAKELK